MRGSTTTTQGRHPPLAMCLWSIQGRATISKEIKNRTHAPPRARGDDRPHRGSRGGRRRLFPSPHACARAAGAAHCCSRLLPLVLVLVLVSSAGARLLLSVASATVYRTKWQPTSNASCRSRSSRSREEQGQMPVSVFLRVCMYMMGRWVQIHRHDPSKQSVERRAGPKWARPLGEAQDVSDGWKRAGHTRRSQQAFSA